MLNLLKNIGASWEQSRDGLYADLEQIETILNRKWTIAFGGSGLLDTTLGGTGLSSYIVGDLLYANTTETLAKLKDVATGNALISGGVGAAPIWSKIGLTTHISGTLPVANGGTGTLTAFTPGSVVFAGASGVYTQNNGKLFWDNTNFRLGIGNASPTALLHLSAGTATANTAPLKLTSGTNLTTAEAGAVEYNGTNLFFTRAGTTREGVLTQTAVTTEALVSDTSVTVNINGTTYKLLARA